MGFSRQECWRGVPLPSPCVNTVGPINILAESSTSHQIPEIKLPKVLQDIVILMTDLYDMIALKLCFNKGDETEKKRGVKTGKGHAKNKYYLVPNFPLL